MGVPPLLKSNPNWILLFSPVKSTFFIFFIMGVLRSLSYKPSPTFFSCTTGSSLNVLKFISSSVLVVSYNRCIPLSVLRLLLNSFAKTVCASSLETGFMSWCKSLSRLFNLSIAFTFSASMLGHFTPLLTALSTASCNLLPSSISPFHTVGISVSLPFISTIAVLTVLNDPSLFCTALSVAIFS